MGGVCRGKSRGGPVAPAGGGAASLSPINGRGAGSAFGGGHRDGDAGGGPDGGTRRDAGREHKVCIGASGKHCMSPRALRIEGLLAARAGRWCASAGPCCTATSPSRTSPRCCSAGARGSRTWWRWRGTSTATAGRQWGRGRLSPSKTSHDGRKSSGTSCSSRRRRPRWSSGCVRSNG
jgi:hypothetical protein